jgi:hypothetical protein
LRLDAHDERRRIRIAEGEATVSSANLQYSRIVEIRGLQERTGLYSFRIEFTRHVVSS